LTFGFVGVCSGFFAEKEPIRRLPIANIALFTIFRKKGFFWNRKTKEVFDFGVKFGKHLFLVNIHFFLSIARIKNLIQIKKQKDSGSSHQHIHTLLSQSKNESPSQT